MIVMFNSIRLFSFVCVCLWINITVSVGYEYESCPDVVLWEKRAAGLQGFELMPSNLGGWTLNQHHILNLESGE